MLFRKSKNLVGLDIGSSAVKLVELKESKDGRYQLVKAGMETLSPEAIVDGAIMDSSLVVETIVRLLAAGEHPRRLFARVRNGLAPWPDAAAADATWTTRVTTTWTTRVTTQQHMAQEPAK